MKKRLDSILEEIEMKENALEIISKKLRQKQEELYKINSGEDYYKAREKIKLLVGEFLGNKKKVIALSITSIISALKEDPDKQIIIDSLLNSSDKNQLDPKVIILLQEKVREYAEKIYCKISDVCTDSVLHP